MPENFTSIEIQDLEKLSRVMVRGYGGEPRALLVGERRGRLVEVLSLDRSACICVSATEVFSFDPELFSDLSDAYDTGEVGELNELWVRARAYQGYADA